ncbi:MAG: host-nuclease inhibitor Gam family protein [Magnetococcales bacterium]|nr:host-nuclease inhibitor Gam family protein [Magnetococcales bacterium]
MSARVKPAPVLVIADLPQADVVLGEMAMLQRALDIVETDMNRTIEAAKRSAEAFASPRQTRLRELERALTVFAETRYQELFGTGKSVTLNWGTFGYRRSSELKPRAKLTWAIVLEKIKSLGIVELLRTRTEVNREAMRDWTDERLELVGVERVRKDVFWYETKKEELVATRN